MALRYLVCLNNFCRFGYSILIEAFDTEIVCTFTGKRINIEAVTAIYLVVKVELVWFPAITDVIACRRIVFFPLQYYRTPVGCIPPDADSRYDCRFFAAAFSKHPKI